MKKSTCMAVFLAIVIITLFANKVSATPPKPGANCNKVGKVQIYSGKKFTCVKKDKRLVWNKGVALKSLSPQLTPAARSTPNVTSSPSASVTPSATSSSSSNSPILPIPSPTTNPIKNFTPGEAVAAEVETNFRKLQGSLDGFDVMYSPTTKKDDSIIIKLLQDLQFSYSYWETLGVRFDDKISVIFTTELDQKWWNELKPKLGISCNFECDNYVFEKYKTQPYMGYAVANNQTDDSQSGLSIFFFLSSELKSDKDIYWARVMAPHEFVHVVQFQLTPGRTMGRYACWYIEGLARFYERATQFSQSYPVGYDYQKFKSDELDFFSYLISRDTKLKRVENWSIDDYLDFLISNQAPSSETCLNIKYGYKLGWPLSEKLYIDFGPKVFIELLKEINRSKDWDKAFYAVTKVPHVSWLKNSGIPYLLNSKN